MIESGVIKQNRNQTARNALSNRYNAKSAATKTTNTVTTASGPASNEQPRCAGSLWADPEIQRTLEGLSTEDRYKFSVIGEELYKKGGFMDNVIDNRPASHRDPQSVLFDMSAQLQTMLRDGLDPLDLTKDEERILISTMGPDDAKAKYGLSLPEEEIQVSHLPERRKRPKKGSRRTLTGSQM